ncbi:MAG: hypothetical protein Q3977_05210, partial [Oscillospiraceae bacterium]|nr:hypothetical protein [Oscillospiraceae bacterium]
MKKILAIALAAILLLSVLTACGGNNAANAEVAGTWTGVYTKYVGDPTKMDETFSLELKADGTGVHHRDDTDFDVKWKLDGENFSMTESFLGTIEYTGTLTGDTLSIFNGDPTNDFTYNYVYTRGDAAEVQDAAQETEQESADIVTRIRGDWNGCVAFRECTGKYEESLGDSTVAAIARIRVNDDGSVEPFIGLQVEDTPIKNLTAKFDESAGCLLVSGEWISVPFEDVPFTEANGTLSGVISIAKEAG